MKKKIQIAWNAERSAIANSRVILPGLASQFFAMGRQAVHPEATPEQLHALRLAGKRLRYTLELFEPCYGRGMAKRLKMLKSIQDYLGELNDCATAEAVVERLPAGNQFAEFLAKRAAKLKAEFIEHWTMEFDKPGAEAGWRRYLARQPASAGKAQAGVSAPPGAAAGIDPLAGAQPGGATPGSAVSEEAAVTPEP